MAITHALVAATTDTTDGEIHPSDWNANHAGTLGSSQGGTAVANSSGTSLTINSTSPLGFTLTGASTVTLPTSGTLLTQATIATLASSQGGTATANSSAFSLAASGFPVGFTFTAASTVTFPTSGTLQTSAATELASLATVGTITSGTWSATTISAAKGGTGVANNASSTITINGSFPLGVTISAASTVTLPTSGSLGYLDIPANSQNGAYTTVLADRGKSIVKTTTTAITYTIAGSDSVVYPWMSAITFTNASTAGAITITCTSTKDRVFLAASTSTANRSLAALGVATAVLASTSGGLGNNDWIMCGTGLT